MVAEQVEMRGVTDPAVLEAMRRVPRHLFVSEGQQRQAYDDNPLPIGHAQTISQPYIVAYMTEILELAPEDRVLEVGTGSGYQAAILSEIVAEVYSIEIIPELVENARDNLDQAGCTGVHIKTGDGYYGWEEHAPYDAIIVTAAAGEAIPPPLIEQLKPGGRMIIPVGPMMHVQYLMFVRKTPAGKVIKERRLPVRFVPLTGGP